MSLPIAFSWTVAWGAEVPAPSFDRVDHDDLRAALVLPRSLGSRKRIEAIAREAGGATFEEKLNSIATWMNAHLVYDDTAAYHWRDVDTILDEGRYGGCADQAMVFGAVARAADIPVVWVKTMDVDWIRAFRTGPEPDVWSGHVYLEVWDGTRWDLLDVAGQHLYDRYDPNSRLVPGNRYAYDKGVDPYALILSTRWLEWKKQTRAYFSTFDLALISGAPERGSLVIVGDNPGYDVAADHLSALGYHVGPGGNGQFDLWMPAAVGHTLVVLSVGGDDILVEPYRSQYVGGSFADLDAAQAGAMSWVEEHTADDGTHVVLVHGDSEADLASVLADLDPGRAHPSG